ncbi:golgi SNAP receptor complex member, putative [Ixodes scapularis]|uniref:Golgi SNAP receptor complex member 1 n=1 Tax=Ixodes scapularis TaxID=6945 RepID=B7PXC5_IXOSC|nr:golgi SNAP receptor complex member, putative [Ixodes scapularis]|eukprot:XP_002400174.1 golgi SNAP receptor complex member, putative [Ixodes scapularis]
MASAGGYTLEDLRKQARHLENEIDLKLVSFSKLGTGLGSRDVKSDGLDTAPLLSSDHMFETMTLEIEQLLSKLGDVNDQMSQGQQLPFGQHAPGGATVVHTLQRHRDILQDYAREFQKTRANVQAQRQRDLLLGSVRKDIESYKNSSSLSRRSDGFLKEHEHLRNSDRMVHDQINIAMRTKDELMIRVGEFVHVLNDDDDRFPMINSLVQRINLRKRRDSIILGLLIGTCTVLLLLYITH